MILDLVYYGDPFLRKRAQEVTTITDEVKTLVRDMEETMNHHKGIGLAATQVASDHRLFITNLVGEKEDGELILGDVQVYINPKILHLSEELSEQMEGCLSIPGLSAPVVRPLKLNIEAQNLEGETFQENLEGYVARCRLHELDHLNGTLFVDRIKGKKRTELEPMLRRVKVKYKK